MFTSIMSRSTGVIKLIDWFELDNGSIMIVMEKLNYDLHEYLQQQKQRVLSEEMTRNFFKQIIETVLLCTDLNVFHDMLVYYTWCQN